MTGFVGVIGLAVDPPDPNPARSGTVKRTMPEPSVQHREQGGTIRRGDNVLKFIGSPNLAPRYPLAG